MFKPLILLTMFASCPVQVEEPVYFAAIAADDPRAEQMAVDLQHSCWMGAANRERLLAKIKEIQTADPETIPPIVIRAAGDAQHALLWIGVFEADYWCEPPIEVFSKWLTPETAARWKTSLTLMLELSGPVATADLF